MNVLEVHEYVDHFRRCERLFMMRVLGALCVTSVEIVKQTQKTKMAEQQNSTITTQQEHTAKLHRKP
jgi:hypothetical protein